MRYYFCFYHIHAKGHINYHHVIIKARRESEIKDLETENYYYRLMSTMFMELSDKDKELPIVRALIMDGESLSKRLKNQKTKPSSNESIRI